jgi:hypothetical protein
LLFGLRGWLIDCSYFFIVRRRVVIVRNED